MQGPRPMQPERTMMDAKGQSPQHVPPPSPAWLNDPLGFSERHAIACRVCEEARPKDHKPAPSVNRNVVERLLDAMNATNPAGHLALLVNEHRGKPYYDDLVAKAKVLLAVGRGTSPPRKSAQRTAEPLDSSWAANEAAVADRGLRPPSRLTGEQADASLELRALLTPRVCIERFTSRIVQELQLDPTRLRFLQPSEFEEFVADRLDRMGFEPTIVGTTNRKDGGIDIIAVPKTHTLAAQLVAVQVKHHSGIQKTGRAAVDRLLAWKGTCFGVGLVVTNTHFTKDAMWLAEEERNRCFLRLRDFDDIKRWLQNNFTADVEWRELPRQIALAPGVVVEVPAIPHW